MSAKREWIATAAQLRAEGRPCAEIAAVLRARFGLRAPAALRHAHGWSQGQAAEQWTARWPDNPKTYKDFSDWETGRHTPSLDVFDRLARLYQCDLADLLADRPGYRHLDGAAVAPSRAGPVSPGTEGWHDGDVDRRAFMTGSGTFFASTVAHLEHLVSTATGDQQRQPALRLLGEAHASAAQVAFDQLDFTRASGHLSQAYGLGVEVGDPDMAAGALVHLGDVARRQCHYNTAFRRLHRAQQHASGAGLATQIRRLQVLARTHAEVQDRRAFEEAIGRAEHLAPEVSSEHHDTEKHNARTVSLERGQGLTLLGDPEAALAIYDRTASTDLPRGRERGSFVIIRAQGLAHAGHLDEGVRLAIEGLGMARSYESPRHISRVQRMYTRLTHAWSSSEPLLAHLREALAA